MHLREESHNMKKIFIATLPLTFFCVAFLNAAENKEAKTSLVKARMALNWVPEPEFGGLYTAKLDKLYEKAGKKVII
jgi:ABC-type nitrate/sulfonate/bicarbonate transport system substrate-binding protein